MLTTAVALAAFVLQPALQRPVLYSVECRKVNVYAQGDFANDGAEDEVNWDEEAKKLDALAKPMNRFYKAVSDIQLPELLKDFTTTAPEEVQAAVKVTVASLLGNMPPTIGDSAILTTGKSLATLMFNMQMTGYMLRNAQFKRSLVQSLEGRGSPSANRTALPPVSGSISVKIAKGMEAQADASAYMAELRSEVEGLRAQLAKAKQKADAGDEKQLIQYIQELGPAGQQELTQDVSPDVLEAMGQLVATILIDLNIDREMEMAAPVSKVRELLVWQLVSGYKLRELEVKDELFNKFLGADGKGAD